jgi:pimeloyl-ACP methyl ester carboxylesterase
VNPYEPFDTPALRAVPASPFDRLQFEIGRWVDEGSLLYEAWRIGRTPPARIRERAERYRQAVAFLEERGAFDEPSRIFDGALDVPEVERKSQRYFGLPPCESIRFESRPSFAFPESFGTAVRDVTGRNRMTRSYLFRSPVRGRPALICIHGYRAGVPAIDARAFGVSTLCNQGFDVALATLPFHGARAPQGTGSGQLFLNDPLRTLEAVIQAVSDLRRLARWLRAEGAPSVGVMGMSLGGYMTALFASIEPDLEFAVPVIPVASFADILWNRAGRRGEHDDARAAGIDLGLLRKLFSPHCPLHHRPLVAQGRRLVVAGEADRIVPPEHAAALAAHWQAPIEWFPGGHLAQLARGRALARFIRIARNGNGVQGC